MKSIALVTEIDEIDEKEKSLISYDFLYDPEEKILSFTDAKTR